ncbi:MAG: regulatory protein RecX [Longispora sp.]|nr:regulatory protein RecX [Longispora sp. (in: high G+C Gram-positive bacteria)]
MEGATVPPGHQKRRHSKPSQSAVSDGIGHSSADSDHVEELSPEKIQKQIERSRSICLQQLSARPRTRAELAATLAKKDVLQEAADAVLDRFDEVGLIDDALFAKMWVSSRHHGRGLARRALAQELRRKGIDSSLIDEALSDLDPHAEEDTARTLVSRKMRTVSGAPKVIMRKLVGMLARKGYSPGLAFRIVKEAMEDSGLEAEEFDPDEAESREHDVLP